MTYITGRGTAAAAVRGVAWIWLVIGDYNDFWESFEEALACRVLKFGCNW